MAKDRVTVGEVFHSDHDPDPEHLLHGHSHAEQPVQLGSDRRADKQLIYVSLEM